MLRRGVLGHVLLVVALTAAPAVSSADAPAAGAKRDRPTFAVLHALDGIDVVESTNYASHMHGGDGASIHDASIRVVVKDAKVHQVKVTKIEMLRGHCRTKTWDSRKVLKVTGYAVNDWDNVDPVATGKIRVALPAKADLYSVSVAFDGVSAYQACDRFAFAIRMIVDGKTVAIEAPLEIKRYEPLRRP